MNPQGLEGSRRLLTFRLDQEQRQRIRARLAREGRTMSEVVTNGLRQYVQAALPRGRVLPPGEDPPVTPRTGGLSAPPYPPDPAPPDPAPPDCPSGSPRGCASSAPPDEAICCPRRWPR